MKSLLIIPPVAMPIQYHLAVPLLAGQLEKSGYEASCFDANTGFFNYVLTPKNIKKYTKQIKTIYQKLHKEFKNISDESELNDIKQIERYHQYKKLLNLYKSDEEIMLIDNCYKYINSAKNIYKEKDKFYNSRYLNKAFNYLIIATQILNFIYPDFKISFHGAVKVDEQFLNLEYLDKYVDSKFVFSEYYEKITKEIKKKKPDLIGISIAYEEQVIPSLILAYILKKHTKSKIVLGGSHLSRVIEELPNKKLMFDKYCDYIILENGETALVELCKYLENKIPIEQVSNLIYKNKNDIITNNYKTIVPANMVHPVNLKGLKLNEYLSAELVAPLQLSKGCYWGKCSFCTCTTQKIYSVRNISSVIEEIKYLIANGINKFTIVDEAISPNLLNKLADAIFDNNLQVYYMIDARFEDGFDSKLFKKAYDSGLRFILWGFETANERIHTLMNKDVSFNNRKNILKAAAENNIFNHLFVFHGFPTATLEEELETLHFVNENNQYIGSFVSNAYFVLNMNSEIANNPERFRIKKIKHEERVDFSNRYEYEEDGLSSDDKKYIDNLSLHIRKSYFNYPLPLYIRETLLLYLSKYNYSDFKTLFNRPYNAEFDLQLLK